MRAPLIRLAVCTALIFLFLISLASGYSLDMAGLQKHAATYNSNIDKAPGLLKSVLGSERVNLIITKDDGSVFRAGMNVQSGEITRLISGGYGNATITVTTDQSSINQVVGAKDKITTFTNMVDAGKIKIETDSWISSLKIKSVMTSSSVLQFGFDLFFG